MWNKDAAIARRHACAGGSASLPGLYRFVGAVPCASFCVPLRARRRRYLERHLHETRLRPWQVWKRPRRGRGYGCRRCLDDAAPGGGCSPGRGTLSADAPPEGASRLRARRALVAGAPALRRLAVVRAARVGGRATWHIRLIKFGISFLCWSRAPRCGLARGPNNVMYSSGAPGAVRLTRPSTKRKSTSFWSHPSAERGRAPGLCALWRRASRSPPTAPSAAAAASATAAVDGAPLLAVSRTSGTLVRRAPSPRPCRYEACR